MEEENSFSEQDETAFEESVEEDSDMFEDTFPDEVFEEDTDDAVYDTDEI